MKGRFLVLLAVLLEFGSARNAHADPMAAPPTTDGPLEHEAAPPQPAPEEDDEPSDSAEPPRLSQPRILALRQEHDAIHRGGPIALLVAGGAVGVLSLEFAQLGGLNGMSDSSSPPSRSSPTGLYVASGVGFTAAVVGLFWLFDCNRRRGELEDRIEKLSGRPWRLSTLVLPAFNPTTKSAELTLFRRF